MSWWEIIYNAVILLILVNVKEHQDYQNSKLAELGRQLDKIKGNQP